MCNTALFRIFTNGAFPPLWGLFLCILLYYASPSETWDLEQLESHAKLYSLRISMMQRRTHFWNFWKRTGRGVYNPRRRLEITRHTPTIIEHETFCFKEVRGDGSLISFNLFSFFYIVVLKLQIAIWGITIFSTSQGTLNVAWGLICVSLYRWSI